MSSVSLNQSENLLIDVLGFENVESPYIDDLVVKEEISAQFLELICIHEHKRVEAWLSGKYGHRSREHMYWLQAGSNPLDVKLEKGNGLLIPLIITSDVVSFQDAIWIIIRGCGFSQLGFLLGEKPSERPHVVLLSDASRVIAPRCLTIRKDKYIYKDVIFIRNYSGKINSGVVQYQGGDSYILLPLALYKVFNRNIPIYFLSLGIPESGYGLLNANTLNLNKDSSVFFFDNFRLASDFSSRIKDSSVINDREFISTAHFDGFSSIKDVDYSCQRSQNVVIIPSPTKESHLAAFDVAEKCLSVGASSVKIYNECILKFKKTNLVIDTESNPDPFNRHILNNSYFIQEYDLLHILHRIDKYSVNIEDYRRWARLNMLIHEKDAVVDGGLQSLIKNMGELVKSPIIERRSSNFSLDNLLRPNKFMEIIGSPNSGKTMALSSILVAISDGSDVFMFKDNSPRRILLVDCETGESDLQKIYMQCGQILSSTENSLGSIDYISLIDLISEYDFDLTSLDLQAELIDIIRRKKYDLFVIDNLHSLDSRLSSSKSEFDKLYKFFIRLGSINVSVLILHHTPDNDKTRPFGISRLQESFHTIMALEGADACLKELNREDKDSFVAIYTREPGAFIRVSFKKCKPDPRLEKQTFYYHLPLVDITKYNAKQWIADPKNYSLDSTSVLSETEDRDVEVSLGSDLKTNPSESRNSKSVFDIDCDRVIEFATENINFNGAQIMNEFSWPKRYVTRILRTLVQSRLLDRTGKTSETKYRIRFKANDI